MLVGSREVIVTQTAPAPHRNHLPDSRYADGLTGHTEIVDGAQRGDRASQTQVIELDGDPDAPSRGRHAVTAVLDGWGCETGTREDLLLVVSELVTNAVVHGAEPIVVTMVRAPERVRVEVTDGAAGSSPHGNPRPPTTPRPAAACPWSPGSRWPGAGAPPPAAARPSGPSCR